jgi:hypothetical protein
MRYFLDTEFIERGARLPIDIISVGIAAADGREFYAVSTEFDPEHANEWVRANVLPHVEPVDRVYYKADVRQIAELLQEFCDPSEFGVPEFWGYFSDYDWVVFCQIFGSMASLPEGFPMFCCDIKQLAFECDDPALPEPSGTQHNALYDARWNKQAFEFLRMNYCGRVGRSLRLGNTKVNIDDYRGEL